MLVSATFLTRIGAGHRLRLQAYTSMMTTLATLGRTMDILSLLQLAQDEVRWVSPPRG
jgi:hypothetical protein